jgi:hypothetical protein
MARCKLCGEPVKGMRAKAASDAALMLGKVVGMLTAARLALKPPDYNIRELDDFIREGADLARAHHETAHGRGKRPEPRATTGWWAASKAFLRSLQAERPGIFDDPQLLELGGKGAWDMIVY